jgi:hypothetical protein
MLAKKIDAKGRLTLGQKYANIIVLINETDGGDILIKKAEVVPAREAWLHKNERAMRLVEEGLEQVKNKEFATNPLEEEENEDMRWIEDV